MSAGVVGSATERSSVSKSVFGFAVGDTALSPLPAALVTASFSARETAGPGTTALTRTPNRSTTGSLPK
jgi:hypothetical protein